MSRAEREFWVASGHHLARLDADGRLRVTDELLLAWLARPEILPPEEACAAERALHAWLLDDPRRPVAPDEIAALADADARENWRYFIAFRDLLLAEKTVEAAYLRLVREVQALPPIFLQQLVHLVMRNALDGCGDPFTLRAAELFWRPQRASLREGVLVLADAERVEAIEAEAAANPLMAMLGELNEAAIEAMTPENAWTYWSRSDAHAMALPFGAERAARAGLAGAIAAFLRHLLGLDALVEPLAAAEVPDLRWYVGLDAAGSAIGDALWRGEAPRHDLVGLFRLSPVAPDAFAPHMEGHPVYLLMGLGSDRMLRLKPQNLVVNLPLAAGPDVSRRRSRPWRASI
jgi:hypothetical protein